MIACIDVYSYTLFACVIYAVMIIINRNIKTLALISCRKYVANFVVNIKNVVFVYMNNAPKYTITDKIRFNVKETENLKNSFFGSRILPEVKTSIRYRASAESIHGSTSIEGNPLNINEVRALVYSDKILSKEEYAEVEVQNYKNALGFISKRRHIEASLSIVDILELHRIITDRLLDKTRNGKLRHNSAYIENQDGEIVYGGAAVEDLAFELNSLLFYIDDGQFSVHSVLLAGILHFKLVAIRPFSDGNGRTARAATPLFLALNQYDCNGALALGSYYSIDKKIYYAILQLINGKDYAHLKNAYITAWLEYFTDGSLSSLHVLNAEIRMLNLSLSTGDSNVGLSRENEDILSYVAKISSINISEAEDILPEMNRRSIQRRLKQLVDDGYLEAVGATHEAKYIL